MLKEKMEKNMTEREQTIENNDVLRRKGGKLYIEDVRVFSLPRWIFGGRAGAFTVPGVGIFVCRGCEGDLQMLMHEYGHVLQRRRFGFWFYWLRVAPLSLYSGYKSMRNWQFRHRDTWTEWSANRLAFVHFGHPDGWDHRLFSLVPYDAKRAYAAFPGAGKKNTA